MNFTETELAAKGFNRRPDGSFSKGAPELPHCDEFEISDQPEAKLHDDIIAECRTRGWFVVHSRMDRPTTTALGVTDFIIALPAGVTWWVEAKRKGKKPTPAQMGVGVMLKHLAHRHAVVYSIEQFRELVK
jgi:hypothetical protein